MPDCPSPGTVKAHRLSHGLDRNPVAVRAAMGARTLSMIEDGKINAVPGVIGRIHVAIDSLASETYEEAG